MGGELQRADKTHDEPLLQYRLTGGQSDESANRGAYFQDLDGGEAG